MKYYSSTREFYIVRAFSRVAGSGPLAVKNTLIAHRKSTTDDYNHNSIPLTIEGFEEHFKFINGDQVERVIQPSKYYMPSHASHTFTRDSINDLLGVHLAEDELYNRLLVKGDEISDV